ARLVREHEWWLDERSIDTANVDLGPRIAGSLIVVPAEEHHVDRGIATPPLSDHPSRLRFPPLARVKEVPEKHSATRAGARQRRVEAGERASSRSSRHWNARSAERGRLSEVRVGDEQRPRPLPVSHTLWHQHQLLFGNLRDRIAYRALLDHPAAFSSASAMRRMRSANCSDDTFSRFRSTTSGNPNG